jgi:hypothetical protein
MTPVAAELVRFVTLVPSSCGKGLDAVGAYTKPTPVRLVSPEAETVPPKVAVVVAMLALVGVVTVGRLCAVIVSP